MIHLSKQSILALQAVLDIALNSRPHPVRANQITKRHNMPLRHLEQTMQNLVKAKILKGIRGPKGGYCLAKARRHIRLSEVIKANSQQQHPPPNPNNYWHLLYDLDNVLLKTLNKITIDDLCKKIDQKPTTSNKTDFTI